MVCKFLICSICLLNYIFKLKKMNFKVLYNAISWLHCGPKVYNLYITTGNYALIITLSL